MTYSSQDPGAGRPKPQWALAPVAEITAGAYGDGNQETNPPPPGARAGSVSRAPGLPNVQKATMARSHTGAVAEDP